jgi:tetratricopeptide (TPR) repeat protein
VGAISLGLFLAKILHDGWSAAIASRNAFPLGHSNYVAGFAVLMLPLGVAQARHARGGARRRALVVVLFAATMLFTSGSRGGLIGLGVLALGWLWSLRLPRAKKLLALAAAVGAGGLFILANPRTRATFTGGPEGEVLTTSAIQRSAMAHAGWKLGTARPLLGWGPGATPLAYPKFRAVLDGGAENVLQLHSTPIHIWAEFGAAGLACLAGFVLLAARDRARDPVAALTLAAYGAFALTDWQMDVPLFAGTLATVAALLAAPGHAASRAASWGVALGAAAVCAAVVFFGQPDPTPALNVRALTLARDPAKAAEAIALLDDSLARNPDQEIAHFNLGWLLLVRDPAAAERHFRAAAHLVPDKGGVYFGLGLAQLNQGRRDDAARAFALECLNDPRFLSSPWWREPSIAPLRDASAADLAQFLTQLKVTRLSVDQLGRVPEGPERTYRRTRTGYPVLMRNLDLAPPDDLFDVREAVAADESAQKLPPKGWLPSPVILKLLDGSPANPRSAIGHPK